MLVQVEHTLDKTHVLRHVMVPNLQHVAHVLCALERLTLGKTLTLASALLAIAMLAVCSFWSSLLLAGVSLGRAILASA